MLVIDASVVVDFLLARSPHAPTIARRLRETEPDIAAPYLLDVEVAQVLRRFTLNGELPSDRAAMALDHLVLLPVSRYDHRPLLQRAFQLRDNVTMYDAMYIALAEGLNATLLTLDEKLAGAPGHSATVEVIGS